MNCLGKFNPRTNSHHINVFGEELIIENTDIAIKLACEQTESAFKEYTVAPKYIDGTKKGAHQWLIEFSKAPQDINRFLKILDNKIQELNSDYEAKRKMVLSLPEVMIVDDGTFNKWLKSKDKLGGQNKIPRLSNNRTFIEEILQN